DGIGQPGGVTQRFDTNESALGNFSAGLVFSELTFSTNDPFSPADPTTAIVSIPSRGGATALVSSASPCVTPFTPLLFADHVDGENFAVALTGNIAAYGTRYTNPSTNCSTTEVLYRDSGSGLAPYLFSGAQAPDAPAGNTISLPLVDHAINPTGL